MADGIYYGLTINARGTSTTAYYNLVLNAPSEIWEGGATIVPTQIGSTLVSLQGPFTMNVPPAGSISAGLTVLTSANGIAGHFTVSPALNVPVVLALYGVGGKQLDTFTLEPGQANGVFSWDVNPEDAMTEADAGKIVPARNKSS
jgi:hypothetical protein